MAFSRSLTWWASSDPNSALLEKSTQVPPPDSHEPHVSLVSLCPPARARQDCVTVVGWLNDASRWEGVQPGGAQGGLQITEPGAESRLCHLLAVRRLPHPVGTSVYPSVKWR